MTDNKNNANITIAELLLFFTVFFLVLYVVYSFGKNVNENSHIRSVKNQINAIKSDNIKEFGFDAEGVFPFPSLKVSFSVKENRHTFRFEEDVEDDFCALLNFELAKDKSKLDVLNVIESCENRLNKREVVFEVQRGNV